MVRNFLSIGYEGKTIDEFIGVLVELDVHLVVDVRELPLSRKPGFSKTGLNAALASAGITYVHERSLGNPKENRSAFRTGSEDARETFRSHLRENGRQALDAIVQRSEQTVALVCFEHEHDTCHRSIVIEELETLDSSRGVMVA